MHKPSYILYGFGNFAAVSNPNTLIIEDKTMNILVPSNTYNSNRLAYESLYLIVLVQIFVVSLPSLCIFHSSKVDSSLLRGLRTTYRREFILCCREKLWEISTSNLSVLDANPRGPQMVVETKKDYEVKLYNNKLCCSYMEK